MKIAYQGVPGAFGHEAGLALAPDSELVAQESFADVVGAVLAEEVTGGVLPLKNSKAGLVAGNAELLQDERLVVVQHLALPVRMHLLALPGVKLTDVRTVVSHPVALAQCASFLRKLKVATKQASNTAVAAAALKRRDGAVLASEAAANLYGLHILVRDAHDDTDNITTFALFERATLDPAPV